MINQILDVVSSLISFSCSETATKEECQIVMRNAAARILDVIEENRKGKE